MGLTPGTSDLSETNPYESPKSEQPLKTGQIVKRGLGVLLILLLTPPAIGIATLIGCGATDLVFRFVYPNYPSLIFLCWTAFFAPPVIVFFTMILWAISLARTQKPTKNPGHDDQG